MSNSSIWPIDRTLSGAITPGHSGPGNNGNDGVLHIPQSPTITGTSPSDCSVSYPVHSLGVVGSSYTSTEMQSVYSTVLPADWPGFIIVISIFSTFHCYDFFFKSHFFIIIICCYTVI